MATTNDNLLSARDAAEFLGVTDRHLRRLYREGKLRRERRDGAYQANAPVFYEREDLEAIKADAPNQYPVPETGEANGAAAGAAMARESKAVLPVAASPRVPALVDLILARLGGPAPLPWVSVEEAAASSGLSVARLLLLAPRLARRGDAVRGVRAKRADGGFESCSGWKIRRAALDGPLPPPSV